MVTKLTKLENGYAVPIDSGMLESMQVDETTELRVRLEGTKLIIEPAVQFDEIAKTVADRHADALKILAQ